jgi:hypothetical protein
MRVHNISDLREVSDNFESLSKKEKMELSREVEPEYEYTFYNVTTDALHQYFVDNLDPANTSPEANISVSYMGLGTDGASGVTTGDTDLNTRTYSEPVTDIVNNGKDILSSTFLDSSEGNGNTFDEIGLFTGDPANLTNADVFLMNHSSFSGVTKDSSKTTTFDVTLTFSDV